MGSQPQKTQGRQKKFFHDRFCRAVFSDHFGKKNFLNRSIFFMLLPKFCQNHAKMLYKGRGRISNGKWAHNRSQAFHWQSHVER
jgi:hypothetical protein